MFYVGSMADEYDPASPILEIDKNDAVKQLSLDKENLMKPGKVKSRWHHNIEMVPGESNSKASKNTLKCVSDNKDVCTKTENFPTFEILEENVYLFEGRKRTKQNKEVRRMLCECTAQPNEIGCRDFECLNRMLMIECSSRCLTGEACSNRRFSKKLYAKTEPFKTEKKGFGLKLLEDVEKGTFIIEYVGEVLNQSLFKQRVKQYARENETHYYFMALTFREIIDARNKANMSRFINHSCDPNCETQKWTVNGEQRIGFFAKRDIKAGEELTFDYKFERYGREAQKCFCQSENCKGYIGVSDEITVEINDIETNRKEKSLKRKKSDKEKEGDAFEDLMYEEEIERLSLNGGLTNKEETLLLARLMVRAEDSHSREKLLDIILNTTEVVCLRLFLQYHGLTLFWSWMAHLSDAKLKKKILKALSLLPVPNKTMLLESKILSIVERWALRDNKEKVYPDKEESATNAKSCNTSDSETDGTSSVQTGENTCLNNSWDRSDRTLFSNCDVNMPKTMNSMEETHKSNADIDKSAENSLRSDEESGDAVDESAKDGKLERHTASSVVEIADLAENLIESWRDLKEMYRIPKLEKGQTDKERKREGEKDNHLYLENEHIKQVSTYKGNTDEKMEEKPSETRVVNRMYTRPATLLKEEKHTLLTKKNKSQDYDRSFSPECSNIENYEYHPPACAGGNSFVHTNMQNPYIHAHNAYVYNTNNSSQPPLLPTPRILPVPPPNIICAGPPRRTATPTSSQPLLPNVMFPPPARSFQGLPFLHLPPPTVPAAIAPCRQNPSNMFIPPPSHLIGITPPIMPLQITASSSGPLGFNNNNNKHTGNSVLYILTAEKSEKENEDPPKALPIKLPPNWKTAVDPDGNIYFYHSITRQTQWDPPVGAIEEKMDVDGTPTYDEPKEHMHETYAHRSHKKHTKRKEDTTTAAADTSCRDPVSMNEEISKKIKELFITKMLSFVVLCLNPYRKDDCKVGRITCNEDFKYLARKLTHFVMVKELKNKKVEDLDANDSVKMKARDYIKKYMERYGPVYRKDKCISGDD